MYTDTITRLENESPLPEFCDQAEGCSQEIERQIKTTIATTWENLLKTILTTVENTETTVVKEIEKSWTERARCDIEFPCCTYGPEYQYNVKRQMTTAKLSIYNYFTDFYEMERKRIEAINECPDQAFGDCSSAGPCWDGSARESDWPTCSCPDFDHNKYQCP